MCSLFEVCDKNDISAARSSCESDLISIWRDVEVEDEFVGEVRGLRRRASIERLTP